MAPGGRHITLLDTIIIIGRDTIVITDPDIMVIMDRDSIILISGRGIIILMVIDMDMDRGESYWCLDL